MSRQPAQFPRASAAACLAVLTLATASSAPAGTIGFRTDAEVKAGPGVDAKVTLTHTGDETAEYVGVRAEMLDRTMDGTAVPALGPGQSHAWNFHLFDEVARGVYAIVLRSTYTDANGYPFEVVGTAVATVGVQPAPRIFGSVEVPHLTKDGEATARLTAKRPPGRSGDVDVRLVAPSGLEVSPPGATLSFDAAGRATAEFRVRNVKLLPGTTVNVFGLATGGDPGFPQTDTIRGTVRIAAAKPRITSPLFYEAAGAMLLLLALLEGTRWAASRRRTTA